MRTHRIVSIGVAGLLPILCSSPALAQGRGTPAPPSEPATQFERFTARKGVILVKEFHNIGQVHTRHGSPVEVKVVVSSQIGSADKIYALALRQEAKYGANSAILDFDEAEGLARAFPHMLQTLAGMSQRGSLPYTEVFFQGRGQLIVGFYTGHGEPVGYYVQFGLIGSERTAFLEQEQFTKLGEFVKLSVTKLRELGAR
jgi:hypothetical protein